MTGRPGQARRRPAARPVRHRLAAAGRAALAVVVLVGLLVGVPAALVALGADPLAVRLPSLNRVGQLLTSPDDGTLWLTTARVIGWVGWAGFTLSVVVEATAAVVGSAVPVLRGLGAVQRPAGYLIALITTTLVAPTAAAAGAAAAVSQTAAATPAPPTPHPMPTPPAGGGSGGRASHPATTNGPPSAGVAEWGGAQRGAAGPAAHALPTDRAGDRLPVVRVARYDTLWRLAERHLRDGRRWTEIYRLNTDHPQPDGTRLTDPDQIRPGWLLRLPADATGTTPPPTTAAATAGRTGSVVVQPGDTLSGLAARHLGTAAAARALFEANAGRPQPDGGRLTDPDLIRPGWILTLPTTPHTRPTPPPHPSTPGHDAPTRPPAGRPTTPPAGRPTGPPTSRPPIPPTPTPPAPSPPVSSPPTVPPAAGSPAASPQPPASSSPSPSVPGAQQADRSPGGWVRLPSGSVLAVGLAATLAGLVVLVRRRWRQHRLPADPTAADPPPPPLPAAAAAAEAAWLATQRRSQDLADDSATDVGDPGEADDDDPLAGTLDDLLDQPDRAVPEVAGVGDGTDQLATESPDESAGAAPRGLTAGGLPAPSLGDLLGPSAAAALAEHAWAGGVGLTGPGAADAARAMLARLLAGAGPLGSQLLTTTAAVAELLPAEAGEAFALLPGVRVFPTVAAALTAGEAELLGRSRRLADTDTPDLAAYRQLPDAEPVPAVLLLAHTPDTPGQATRAQALLGLAGGRDLGAVWLGPWPPAGLHVTTDGTLHTQQTDRSEPAAAAVGRVELLTPADAADLLAGLLPAVRDSLDVLNPSALLPTAPALQPPAPEAPASAPVPPAGGQPADRADTEPDDTAAAGGPVVVEVAVLGRVRVIAAREGREVTGLRAKVRDLLTLLAVHPDGLTGDQVGEALWPDAPPGRVAGRLSATLALARRTLREATGLDTDGDQTAEDGGPVDLVPRLDDRYRLHPDLIDTDHRRFTTALAAARRAGEAGDTAGQLAALHEAADLYQGEPLDGVAYPWAEPVRERLRRQATDTLATLADLHTTDGADAGAGGRQAALDALERAVEVDPYNEELYRRMMRLHAAAGRTDAVRRSYRLLEARLADLDVDPDPDTTALAADLTRPRPRPRPARSGAARQ